MTNSSDDVAITVTESEAHYMFEVETKSDSPREDANSECPDFYTGIAVRRSAYYCPLLRLQAVC
jgi:hypothetical protein